MTKLIDTADTSDAHACGRIDADHENSDFRLRAYRELGGLTIVQGARTTEVEDDDVPSVLNGSTPLGLSPDEREAIASAYWEAVGREAAEVRKAIFGRAA